MGVVGLECAFPLLYTYLVKKGIITLPKLIDLMFTSPHRRFGIGYEIKIGAPADLTVFDLNEAYKIDSGRFLSKGKSTPFEGYEVYGACKQTFVDGRIAWYDEDRKRI